MFMLQTQVQSKTPTASTMKLKEYFTNTIKHEDMLPKMHPPTKTGKRQVQPLQKHQRSVSNIRLNDTYRS